MRHVDDGTLHAYLDGALDALPAVEAERVREHLGTCEACAARLEEERAVREEAAVILAETGPDIGELAPLEELRARAASTTGTRGAAWRVSSLGWAASVVLAIGVGWMLRGAATPQLGGGEPRTVGSPSASASEAGAREDAREERAAPTESRSAEQVAAAPAAVGRERAEGERSQEPPAVPAAKATDRVASRPAPDRVAAGQPPDSGAVMAAATLREPVTAVAGVAVPARPERLLPEPHTTDPAAMIPPQGVRFDTLAFPRSAPEAKRAVASARDEAARANFEALQGRVAPRQATGEAQQLGPDRGVIAPAAIVAKTGGADSAMRFRTVAPRSLVVPGLRVLSVVGLDAEGVAGAVRVHQLLEDGDTLELVHLPAGTDPSVLDPVAGDARTELVFPREGGWLVVRARASRDALLELVRRLDGGR